MDSIIVQTSALFGEQFGLVDPLAIQKFNRRLIQSYSDSVKSNVTQSVAQYLMMTIRAQSRALLLPYIRATFESFPSETTEGIRQYILSQLYLFGISVLDTLSNIAFTDLSDVIESARTAYESTTYKVNPDQILVNTQFYRSKTMKYTLLVSRFSSLYRLLMTPCAFVEITRELSQIQQSLKIKVSSIQEFEESLDLTLANNIGNLLFELAKIHDILVPTTRAIEYIGKQLSNAAVIGYFVRARVEYADYLRTI